MDTAASIAVYSYLQSLYEKSYIQAYLGVNGSKSKVSKLKKQLC